MPGASFIDTYRIGVGDPKEVPLAEPLRICSALSSGAWDGASRRTSAITAPAPAVSSVTLAWTNTRWPAPVTFSPSEPESSQAMTTGPVNPAGAPFTWRPTACTASGFREHQGRRPDPPPLRHLDRRATK